MAVASIAYNPKLTKGEAQSIFARHFEGKYAVEEFKGPLIRVWELMVVRDFMVVKNPFVGVALRLEQSRSETRFVYSGISPRFWPRMLVGAPLGFLFWNGLTKEVRQFIETAPEFQHPHKA